VVSLELLAQLEAVLFASDAPLPLERLVEALEGDPEAVRLGLEALRAAVEAPGRGLLLVEVAGGYRLVTRPEVAPALLRLQRLRLRSRLSRAAVETLAIVAYRQPVSRPEIEQLRGVSVDHVITALLERRLVRVVGRRAVPGRPLLYGTTREFLEHFGLRDLGDLPPFEVPAEAAAAMAAALGSGGVEPAPLAEAGSPDPEAGPPEGEPEGESEGEMAVTAAGEGPGDPASEASAAGTAPGDREPERSTGDPVDRPGAPTLA